MWKDVSLRFDGGKGAKGPETGEKATFVKRFWKNVVWRPFLTDQEQVVTAVVGEALERQVVSFEGSCGS